MCIRDRFDPEGELLGDGTEAEISEDVLLYWDLSGTEDTMFSLTLKTNGKQLTYVLSMRDDGGYDLCLLYTSRCVYETGSGQPGAPGRAAAAPVSSGVG